MLKFYVHGQRLRMETAVVASDTIDYLTAQFLFQTDDWQDTARTAVFRGAGETYSVLLTDDRIRAEDHLNLSAGEWTVHVIGTVSGESGTTKRITTTQVRFMVDDCGAVDGSALPEVPASYGEQVLAAAQAAVATANAVKEAADAGAFKGEKGADGKSAYQYAQEGGYTGSDAEFAEKMAEEKFANPNALTFTGAVAGTYDGSEPLTVEIPNGGSGGRWSQISDKPFNTIDGNTLVSRSGTLCVNTTDDAEQDNTRPITSSGVHVICGNINALLQAI